ncbi:MAG: dehydratase [Actinomycetota bacterium]|nr:dehydratase [Actinomycetota bacterium]
MTRGRTITEADVVAFSGLTGDYHPQHTDAVWAEAGPFGGIVAHGMLVLSYALGLVSLDPERIVALRRFEDVVFKRPVQIGDTIHVEVKLDKPDEGRGLEAYEWRILNQRDELVIRAKVEAVVRGEDDDPEPEDDPEAEPEPAADEHGQPAEGEGSVSR